MSDEGYDADGDVGRYLLNSPLPEPAHTPPVPNDEPPVVTHVVVGPQDVPADDHALQQAPPMMPNPAPATGLHAPAVDVVEHCQAAPAIEIHPPQMVAPDPDQAYGFPEETPPLAAAADTGVDDDDLSSLEGSFEGMFYGDPEGQSLYQQFMSGEDDLAAVEPNARPVEEDPAVFVPLVGGTLDCTNCRTVWESLHESANHKLYLIVHGTGLGTFHHAITDRIYIGADGQVTASEQMYLDLRQRTHDWVQRFIANCVEALRNDSSGQLKEPRSTSSAAAAACTNSSAIPPGNNEAHMQLEIDMLRKILYAPATNDKAVAGPQTYDDIFDGTSWHGLNPPTLDSSNPSVQDGGSSAAEYPSLLGEQRKRLSSMTVSDTLNLLHLSKEEAAKQLNISTSSLQRLFRKGDAGRWPGRRINALNSKIEKLEEAALRHVGTIGLLAIKEKIDKLMLERAQLYESIMKRIRENEMKKGAGSSGNN